MFSGPRKLFNDLDANLLTNSHNLGFDISTKKIQSKIDKYLTMFNTANSDNIRQKIRKRGLKLQDKKDKIENMMVELSANFNYDMRTMIRRIPAIGTLNYQEYEESVFKVLNDLENPTVIDRSGNNLELPEMKHFILGSLIKNYNKIGEPLKRFENVHLFISNIYSHILEKFSENIYALKLDKSPRYETSGSNKLKLVSNTNMENLKSYIKDIRQIEKYLEKICSYLDQRFIDKKDVESNIIINDIFKCITYTTMISIQNSFLLSIKKMLINYIVRVYGPHNITLYGNVIKLLMGNIVGQSKTKLFSDKLDDNFDDISAENENMTAIYIKKYLKIDVIADFDINTFEEQIQEIKKILRTNKYMRIDNNSSFFKEYDEYLVPYYKALYESTVEHQKNLVYNYIKFIIIQYDGIQILRKIMEKVIRT
jgi:hypothetical protein